MAEAKARRGRGPSPQERRPRRRRGSSMRRSRDSSPEGFERTRMLDVARDAGLAKGTLLPLLSDQKEALFEGVRLPDAGRRGPTARGRAAKSGRTDARLRQARPHAARHGRAGRAPAGTLPADPDRGPALFRRCWPPTAKVAHRPRPCCRAPDRRTGSGAGRDRQRRARAPSDAAARPRASSSRSGTTCSRRRGLDPPDVFASYLDLLFGAPGAQRKPGLADTTST